MHGSGLQHGRGSCAGQGHGTEAPNLVRGIVEGLGHVEAYRPATVSPATSCHKHLRTGRKMRRRSTILNCKREHVRAFVVI